MHCKLLLNRKRNASQLDKASLVYECFQSWVSPQVYLSKESFARAWRAIHEDVPVQAVVLSRVSCCYGDVTNTLFQGRLRD